MKKIYKYSSLKRKQNKRGEHYEPHLESGVFGIHVSEDNVLTIAPVKGVSVPLVTFFEIVQQDKGLGKLLVDANNSFERKNPYKILRHEGISGCVDYDIEWIDGYIADLFPVTKRKHLFHTSMYGKINETIRIFLPDFYLLLDYLAEDAANDLTDDFEVEFYEVPFATPEDYFDPNTTTTPLTMQDFVPVMAWQTEEEFLEHGSEAALKTYTDYLEYHVPTAGIFEEYSLSPKEYSALKALITRDFYAKHNLYENEDDTAFIHVDLDIKATSVVLKEIKEETEGDMPF